MKKKKKKTSKISSTITNILMVFSLILLGISIFSVFKNGEHTEDSFLLGFKPVYVKTGSMEPTLRVNGVLIVKKIDYDDVKVDDIIMYYIDEKMVTHRVIDITTEGIRTKGDNNNVEDSYYLQPENIRGKVIVTMNWVADFLLMVSTPKGMIRYIGFPAFVIIVLSVTIFLIKKIGKGLKEDGTDELANAIIDLENLHCSQYADNKKKSNNLIKEYFTWKILEELNEEEIHK